jgi:hypothetical protein
LSIYQLVKHFKNRFAISNIPLTKALNLHLSFLIITFSFFSQHFKNPFAPLACFSAAYKLISNIWCGGLSLPQNFDT